MAVAYRCVVNMVADIVAAMALAMALTNATNNQLLGRNQPATAC